MEHRRGRYRQPWQVMLVGVLGVTLSAAAGDFVPGGPCTRGRVTMNGKTIVTDWGTLLHMGCWGLDMARSLPPREDFKTVKECGVNGMHVYFEKYDASYCHVGYNVELVDSMVEWCRQESLYVILTIGGSIPGTWLPKYQRDIDSTKKIWEFYAPRYADQTHVIYEIKNEPEGTQIRLERECYPIIHAAAPETHVLIGSQSSVAGGPCRVLCPIDSMQDLMDWSNTSVAFHGYSVTGDFQEDVVRAVNDAGHAMTMTECWPNTGLEDHYEKLQISYAPMTGCFDPMAEKKCNSQHGLNLSYAPDFGSWPQAHVEYPAVQAEAVFAAGTRPTAAGGSSVVFPFVTNRSPRGDVQAVYDLSGKLLWRRTDNSNGANGGEGFVVPKGAGSGTVVVKYAD